MDGTCTNCGEVGNWCRCNEEPYKPLTEAEIAEHRRLYNEAIAKIREMKLSEIYALIAAGKCPNPVQHLLGVPLGMFHCELCGTMVIAGMPHGVVDPVWDPEINEMCRLMKEDIATMDATWTS